VVVSKTKDLAKLYKKLKPFYTNLLKLMAEELNVVFNFLLTEYHYNFIESYDGLET
jgi:hypothetical protein